MDNLLDLLASAIATQEGFYREGTIPNKRNNPGDLRLWVEPFPIRTFKTKEEGTAWLYFQLTLYIRRGLTLRQLIAKYAPPNENNTSAYFDFVHKHVPVDPDKPLWNYLTLNKVE